jgi:hypothetical protein
VLLPAGQPELAYPDSMLQRTLVVAYLHASLFHDLPHCTARKCFTCSSSSSSTGKIHAELTLSGVVTSLQLAKQHTHGHTPLACLCTLLRCACRGVRNPSQHPSDSC